ncbi:MAG: hypothetical protein E7456_06030 [Ruminococcaceae bacterium]|nr:hypothetical protein [Oscillospiraceae bacterium]
MKILKKPFVAIIIVLIVALVFSLVGIKLSVTRQAEKVEELFYTGIDGGTGIDTYLHNAGNEAKVIHYTAIQYFDEEYTDGLRDAYNNLIEAETIEEKFKYNQDMLTEIESLIPLIEMEVNMNSYDSIYLETHMGYMDDIQKMIDRNTYNEKVAEFEEEILGKFPVNLVASLLGLEAPEYFA